MKPRLIVIGDIHGNFEAFKATVEDALNNYGTNIEAFVFLGDYCCDFPDANKVVDLIKQIETKYTIHIIRGNRENFISEYYNRKKNNEEEIWKIESSMGAPLISCERMNMEQLEYLSNIPENKIIEIEGCEPIYLQHKMPLSSDKLIELNEIKHILTAHTHEFQNAEYDGINLYNPGAVGLTDSGVQGASYGVMTWQNNHWNFMQKTIPYDYEKTIAGLKAIPELYSQCKNWGKALELAVLTGINVPALYMFELQRVALLYDETKDKENLSLQEVEKEIFSQGRYGNIGPNGELLKNQEIVADENSNLSVIVRETVTQEGQIQKKAPVLDFMYEVALNNVENYINEIQKRGSLQGDVYAGRQK
jgi:Predicted phosphoesterase